MSVRERIQTRRASEKPAGLQRGEELTARGKELLGEGKAAAAEQVLREAVTCFESVPGNAQSADALRAGRLLMEAPPY